MTMSDSERDRPFLTWVNQFALLPSDGGGTRHFEMSRELVKRGWDVSVVASDLHLHKRTFSRRSSQQDRSPFVESQAGVDVRWLWAAPYRRNDWRRVWNWISFGRSVGIDARRMPRPSLVIGSSPQLFAAWAARSAARRWGVPFVMEVRDLWPESLIVAGDRKGVAYRTLDHVARSLYRDATRIIVLAKGSGEYLQTRGIPADKLLYVPNGVDVQAVAPGRAVRPDSALFTVVYAGAHGPANGLDNVLDAAAIIGADAGVRFILVGDGTAKEALRQDSKARGLAHVEFRDSVSKPELFDILATADVGLMVLRDAPLFSFGVSPNKLFDYFAAGLPVVCNVPGEVASIVSAAQAGVQVPDSSGKALAEGIMRLRVLPPAQLADIGHSGRQWVEQNHSREVLGEILDHHLRELIKR